MSASREKKARTGSTHVQRKNNQAQDRRKHLLYGVVGGIIAVLAAALLVWDSGFFQTRTIAVTIDGQDYNVAALQYYYNNVSTPTIYYAQMGLMPDYDPSKKPKDQVKDQETGQTWHDYFMEQAMDEMTRLTALNHAAQKENYVLKPEQQAYVDKTLAQLDNVWRTSGQYTSLKGYIHANYGEYMDEETLRELMVMEMTAMYYQQDHQDSISYTDEELEAYYQEHANELDTFGYSVFVLQASGPATVDEEGKPIELTAEEQQAAFETSKTEAQALAQEIQDKLLQGSDPQALADEYADKLYSSTIHAAEVGGSSALTTAPFAQWLYDTQRKAGEVSIQENDRSDAYLYNYYVVQFESRQRDEQPTADVRHILVSAGSNPTEEQFAQAEERAQALLDEFKAGQGTEADFALLAVQNTADPGSQAAGGLYTGISPATGFIPEFTDWALDPARQHGDTGLVKNEGSSTKGWHIMYFSDWNDPTWKLTASSALTSEAMNTWLEELTGSVEVVQGSGVKYV